MSRWVWGVVVIGIALPGCSTTCSWFGRNSDGSNNHWGTKPTPVQQGPITGSYTRPGNGAMTNTPQVPTVPGQGAPAGQAMTPQQPPQTPFVTSPSATSPNGNAMPASPLNTPPGPLTAPPPSGQAPNLAPTAPVSFKQLPPAELNTNPPSLGGNFQTGEGTPMPDVKGPVVKGPPDIDLTVAAATTAAKKPDAATALNKPTAPPILLAPGDGDRAPVRMVNTTLLTPEVAAPKPLQPPTIGGPEVMPRGTTTMLSTPPPLPAAPTPPLLDVR